MKARKVFIEPEARRDVLAIRAWYSEQGTGLSKRFAQEFARTLKRIAANAESFTVRFDYVRKAGLSVFPNGIYYLIEDGSVRVIAVVADARDQDSAIRGRRV